MPDPTHAPSARAEAAIVSLILAIAIAGLTLLPLTSAPYVRALVSLVQAEELTGLGPDGTRQAAEAVRRFVLDSDARELPAMIAGRPAFDRAAVAHLVDVREVLSPTRTAALGAALIALAWAAFRRARPELLASALTGAGWVLLTSVGAAALAGLTDFDVFFAWFHSLFFAPGTWVFPADALLIRIFPLAFWVGAAVSWAVLVFAVCGFLFAFAHRLRFTASSDGV
ncbi:MAG: lipoprotein intramolecular transacylase Lit [Coriobacteriia bacterium]